MSSFPSNHVSLVTGASTGIGAATAIALGKAGSQVAVHYCHSQFQADEVVEKIVGAGGRAFSLQSDLAEPGGAEKLVSATMDTTGRVDVLVNNAGSMLGRRMLLEITDEFWQQVMETNLGSVLRMGRAVAPAMIAQGSGVMINIASVAARNGGSPGVMPYACAKAGVICLTKGLAKELAAYGIRVNAVNPGIILTPFHEKFTPEDRMKALVSGIAQGRAGTPEEVAAVIAFLAGPGASHITGETIEVNGGLYMD